MFYTVFLAICLSSTPVRDCDSHSAIDWIVAPEQQQGLAACLIHGQEYAANSRLLKDGEYLKVFCTTSSIGKENVG